MAKFFLVNGLMVYIPNNEIFFLSFSTFQGLNLIMIPFHLFINYSLPLIVTFTSQGIC